MTASRSPAATTPHSDSALAQSIRALEASIQRLEPLVRAQAYATALTWLPGIFKDGKQLLAYDLSDGSRSTRDIGRQVGVDQKTISTWWRTWHRDFRIVEKAGKRGQFRARYSLSELIAIHGTHPPAPSPIDKPSGHE
jgi:hypothetical protein